MNPRSNLPGKGGKPIKDNDNKNKSLVLNNNGNTISNGKKSETPKPRKATMIPKLVLPRPSQPQQVTKVQNDKKEASTDKLAKVAALVKVPKQLRFEDEDEKKVSSTENDNPVQSQECANLTDTQERSEPEKTEKPEEDQADKTEKTVGSHQVNTQPKEISSDSVKVPEETCQTAGDTVGSLSENVVKKKQSNIFKRAATSTVATILSWF